MVIGAGPAGSTAARFAAKGGAKVILVGSKGISYVSRYGINTYSEYVGLPDMPATKDVNKIYNDAIYLYKKGEVSEVNIVYTEFISPVKQEVKSIKLIPLEKKFGQSGKYIIEPNEETVFISEADQYLFAQGTHYDIYKKLGAHVSEENGEKGVYFAVWAPNAKEIYLVGEFNNWSGVTHPMENIDDSGIWNIFTDDININGLYKYNVIDKNGKSKLKSDPYAFFSQKRPDTASVVHNIKDYSWKDEEWMKAKDRLSYNDKPMNIYEVHLGSWKRKWDGEFFSYEELYEMIKKMKKIDKKNIVIT